MSARVVHAMPVPPGGEATTAVEVLPGDLVWAHRPPTGAPGWERVQQIVDDELHGRPAVRLLHVGFSALHPTDRVLYVRRAVLS